MADPVLVHKILKARVQPLVEICRQIGIIITKVTRHLLQRQAAGIVLLHIVDDAGRQMGVRVLLGARAQGALLQRSTADHVQPRKLFAPVVARPKQLHQGRSLDAEHRVRKGPLPQLGRKFRHPIVRKYPQHTLGGPVCVVAVDLVRQHQQGLAGADFKGIRFQCTGQGPGLHGQKFIAVVQMRGEAEIVVTLAVEISPPV